jgi:hypothetical protein
VTTSDENDREKDNFPKPHPTSTEANPNPNPLPQLNPSFVFCLHRYAAPAFKSPALCQKIKACVYVCACVLRKLEVRGLYDQPVSFRSLTDLLSFSFSQHSLESHQAVKIRTEGEGKGGQEMTDENCCLLATIYGSREERTIPSHSRRTRNTNNGK